MFPKLFFNKCNLGHFGHFWHKWDIFRRFSTTVQIGLEKSDQIDIQRKGKNLIYFANCNRAIILQVQNTRCFTNVLPPVAEVLMKWIFVAATTFLYCKTLTPLTTPINSQCICLNQYVCRRPLKTKPNYA